MATEILRPNVKISGTWSTNAYTQINSAITQPSAGDGAYIIADKDDDNKIVKYGFENTSFANITSTKCWLLTGAVIDNNGTEFTQHIGGTSSSGDDFRTSHTEDWRSDTWLGTWVHTDINSIEVWIQAPSTMGSGDVVQIDEVYLEVTGSGAIASGAPYFINEHGMPCHKRS